MNNDLISRSALKEAITDYLERRQDIIVWEQDVYNIIDNAPTVDIKPFASFSFDKDELNRIVEERVIEPIKNGELVVKTEERPQGDITEEQAIDKLHETGWLPRHDKEMTERPTGYWIPKVCNFYWYRQFACSECEHEIISAKELPNYCQNCGTKMKGIYNE